MKTIGSAFAPWWALAAVAVVSFAFGAWVARRGAAPRPAVSQALPRPTPSARRAAPADASGRRIASPAPSWAADDATLLATLRLRLADAKGDALRAVEDIAKTDPAHAIDLAQALGRTDEEKAEWVANVVQQWADRDAQAAWNWLAGLSAERMQDFAGAELPTVVLGAMAAQDPKAVVTNLDRWLRDGNASNSVPTSTAVQAGLQALVDRGQLDSARGALDAWTTDPAGLSIESAAYATVATAWGKTAPAAAADWLLKLPTSDERNQAIASFADAWAQTDTRAALQWAGGLSTADGQSDAVTRIVSDCVESRPNEVGTWLADYLSRAPADRSTDRLIETVINLSPVVRDTPPVALSWAGLIADPGQKELYTERTALRWAQQDRAAAMAFVQSTPLIPPSRKIAVFQTLASSAPVDLPRE